MRVLVQCLYIVGFVSGLIGCNQQAAVIPSSQTANTTPAVFNAAGMPTVEFNVPDMMCPESCAEGERNLVGAARGEGCNCELRCQDRDGRGRGRRQVRQECRDCGARRSSIQEFDGEDWSGGIRPNFAGTDRQSKRWRGKLRLARPALISRRHTRWAKRGSYPRVAQLLVLWMVEDRNRQHQGGDK